MEEKIKICPECNAEFYSHIERCNSCGVILISPEEKPVVETYEASANDGFIPIDEGDFTRLKELSSVLSSRGIEPHIVKKEERKSCSTKRCFILCVPESLVDESTRIIADHWANVHPELKEIKEREGFCPACGFKLEKEVSECPECGLNLKGGIVKDDSNPSSTCF